MKPLNGTETVKKEIISEKKKVMQMTSVKPLRYGKVDSDILYFMHKENAVYPSFRRSEWKYASKKVYPAD